MHTIIRHRKCFPHPQFCGNRSTTSLCVIKLDNSSSFSLSDKEPEKFFEDGQSLKCFTTNYQVLDAPLDAYSIALDKCIKQKNLAFGFKLQSLLAKHGHELNLFLSTSLIRLFAACGNLTQADQIFCKLHESSVFSWGAIILAHSKHGLSENAIKLYETFLSSNLQPDGHIYVAALQACANAKKLAHGRCIHAQIAESGHHSHTFVVNSIINMYLKCRSFCDASNVFDTSTTRDAVTWNVMMEGYNQHGWFYRTLLLFAQMQVEGFLLDNMTYVSVLQATSCLESLHQGKMIHALSFEAGLEKDVFIASAMIHMYCQCSRLDDAREVFSARREVRDIVIWCSMLTGLASCGHLRESYELFCQMQQQEGLEIGNHTYTSMLNACVTASALYCGRIIHTYVLESGLKVGKDLGQALIGLYTNCGEPEIASKVFDGLESRDVVTWTAIMSCHADQGCCSKVLKLVCQMYDEGIKADEVIFSTVLKAASIQGPHLDLVRSVHTLIEVDSFQSDSHVRSLLVEFYARFEMYEDVNWIVHNLIKEYFCTEGCNVDSPLFKLPNNPMEEMAGSLLQLYSILEDLEGAQLVHFLLTECDYRWTAQVSDFFISLYASCGMLDDAFSVFEALTSHSITGWTSMIDGYVKHGQSDDAFQLFCRMHEEGFLPDQNTLLSISKAFATSLYLTYGRLLHTKVIISRVGNDRILSNALIEMYARCGSLSEAQRVFDELVVRDTLTWNALIAVYVNSGYIQEAYELFQAIEKEGCKPDASTFVCILKACSSRSLLHSGKLLHHFIYERGVDFSASLVSSLTNMYVKCGSLDDAECLLTCLSCQSKATWGLIISGHAEMGNLERALFLFQKMQQAGHTPDSVTIVSTLKACCSSATILIGMLLHSFLLLSKLRVNIYLANTLIAMYSKCGSLEDARKMFHCENCRDTATWNAIIAGCAQSNDFELAMHYFRSMQNKEVRPNAMTFLCILSMCSHVGNVKDGLHQFHCMIQQHGITPTAEHYNCVVDLLGRAGSLLKAEDLLCSLPFFHNYVGWMSLFGHCKLHENINALSSLSKTKILLPPKYLLMEHVFFHRGHVRREGNVQGLI